MDADRRQGAARADAVAQPLLARHALCDGARAHHLGRCRSTAAISRSSSISSTTCCGCAPATAISARSCCAPVTVARVLRRRDGTRCAELGVDVRIDEMPNEIAERGAASARTARTPPTTATTPTGFWRVLLRVARVFCAVPHRLSRQGEPGAFLLGQLRSGGDALFRPARAAASRAASPDLPDAVAREAYSHEVSSAGFWPGGGPIDYPAFYSYAYPAPEGFAAARGAAGRRRSIPRTRRVHPAV